MDMKQFLELIEMTKANRKGLTLSDAVDKTLDQNQIQGYGREKLHKKICRAIEKSTSKKTAA